MTASVRQELMRRPFRSTVQAHQFLPALAVIAAFLGAGEVEMVT